MKTDRSSLSLFALFIIMSAGFLALLTTVGCSKEVKKVPGELPLVAQPIVSLAPSSVPSISQETLHGIQPSVTLDQCSDQTVFQQGPSLSLNQLIDQAWGFWDLVDYQVTAMALYQKRDSSYLRGVSTLEGDASGVEQSCQDMSELPQGQFKYDLRIPTSFSAVDGEIDEEVFIHEVVVGEQSRACAVLDFQKDEAQCSSLAKSLDPQRTGLAAPGCVATQAYLVGRNQIALVNERTVRDSAGHSVTIRTKATYELWGEGRERSQPQQQSQLRFRSQNQVQSQNSVNQSPVQRN